MTANEKTAWKRLSIEAAAIVGSILLAFAIDAWWEDRQNLESEQIALRSLREDFAASRQELSQRLRTLEKSQIQFAEFQSFNPEDFGRLQQSAVNEMITGLGTGATFDPFLGTIDAMVADGRLALIRNQRIRELLSGWIKAVDDIKEDNVDVRAHAIRVRKAMEPHGGPYFTRYFDQLGSTASEVFPLADASILAELRRDASFVGKARSHQYTISFYRVELDNLAEILDDTIGLIDQNIQ
jgi:hypothetical protein